MTLTGTKTANNIFYKLALGATGAAEKAAFDAGLDTADALIALVSQVQSFYKLKVSNNAVTPATKIDISADSIMVADTSHNALNLKNFSVTVNCGVPGANGLDTGALATGWYYFYAIAKADGTMAGLASTSATTPAMPSGYTFKKLVSALYYTGGGSNSFLPIKQYDKMVWISSGGAALFGVSAASWTLKDLSGVVPSNPISVIVQPYSVGDFDIAFKISWDSGGTENLLRITLAKSPLFSGTPPAWNAVDGTPFTYLLNPSAPQTLYAYGYDSNTRGGLSCLAYELDI